MCPRVTNPPLDKRPRSRVSSSSSTKSKDGQTKRTKFESSEEEEEDFIDSEEDVWSEEEFQVTFKNAPEWAKIMMVF